MTLIFFQERREEEVDRLQPEDRESGDHRIAEEEAREQDTAPVADAASTVTRAYAAKSPAPPRGEELLRSDRRAVGA